MVATVNVTGNYFQVVGSAVPAGLTPRIRVQLSEPAVTANEAVSTIVKEFFPSSGGAFTLPLIPTDAMRPNFGRSTPKQPHYVVTFDAFDAAANYRSAPEQFELYVPSTGGTFMSLVRTAVIGGSVEVTNTGPADPSAYGPGVIILDTSGTFPFLSYTA